MSLKTIIIDEMKEVGKEHHKNVASLSDETPLLECGLDSLCFAILVARLEDRLGLDPFTTSDDVYFPATVGEFVHLYENAVR